MAEQKAPVKKSRKLMKRITTGLAIVLGLVIAFMLFVHFMPGWGLYFVKSGSMEPSISPSDIVITRPVSTLEVGEAITFKQSEAIVTHRIIAIKDGVITTKGDANEDADPHPLTIDRVEGIYQRRCLYRAGPFQSARRECRRQGCVQHTGGGLFYPVPDDHLRASDCAGTAGDGRYLAHFPRFLKRGDTVYTEFTS